MPLSFKRSLRFVWSMWHCASWIQPQGNTMWPNWATAKATLGMKNALEQDLVTNSGREPDSSLFLSFYSSSCLCSCQGCEGRHCCPALLLQELRPPTRAHKVTSPAPRAGGGCQLWPMQGTLISQKNPLCTYSHPAGMTWDSSLSQHWATPARKGWAITSFWGNTLKIASIPEHQKCPAMNCNSLITVIL